MTPNRKAVEEHIIKTMTLLEPGGVNALRYKEKFARMTDKDFDTWMKDIRDKKKKLTCYAPNMQVVLQVADIYKAADYVECKIFEKVTFHDETTGMEYTTPHEFMILRLPVRRVKQYLMHKMTVPESDTRTDALTGQVIKPDKSASFSFVEMQIMHGRGLDNTILEFMKLRGGDLHAYATMKQGLEETGEFSQEAVPQDTVNRSAMTLTRLLQCMLIDNNFVEEN